MFKTGQRIRLQREAIYAHNAIGARLREIEKTIAEVLEFDGATGIRFDGSRRLFRVSFDGEFVNSFHPTPIKYRII